MQFLRCQTPKTTGACFPASPVTAHELPIRTRALVPSPRNARMFGQVLAMRPTHSCFFASQRRPMVADKEYHDVLDFLIVNSHLTYGMRTLLAATFIKQGRKACVDSTWLYRMTPPTVINNRTYAHVPKCMHVLSILPLPPDSPEIVSPPSQIISSAGTYRELEKQKKIGNHSHSTKQNKPAASSWETRSGIIGSVVASDGNRPSR
jgi:hypothetical protein